MFNDYLHYLFMQENIPASAFVSCAVSNLISNSSASKDLHYVSIIKKSN